MVLARGMRDKLAKYVNTGLELEVSMKIAGGGVYDFCCFGVDAAGKLSDDRYMIFYNQTASPAGEIRYTAGNSAATFVINLLKLPQTIDKLVFTVSIDGNGTMGEIREHSFELTQSGKTALEMELAGTDFRAEKAIISAEIYRKDEWRIAAVANGFNGGLSALLAAYGGTEASMESPTPMQQIPSSAQPVPIRQQPQTTVQPVPVKQPPQPSTQPVSLKQPSQPSTQPVSLQHTSVPSPSASAHSPSNGGVSLKKTEEQLTREVMGRISLSKDKVNLEKHVVSLSKCVVSLSKNLKVDLGATRAKVVVVLDYSGSMRSLYDNGTVQDTINRLVPLGLTFDDNGTIDVFLFQNDYRKFEDLNLQNYENYVKSIVRTSGYRMGGTCYAPVLRAIIEGDQSFSDGLFGFLTGRKNTGAIVDNGDPTFILFITDGANSDRGDTDRVIVRCSEMNVFIQFIGIGNERFEYLQKLDDLPGRKRDNTGFSKMQDLAKASDSELYMNVLTQFSAWLNGQQ